MIQHSVYAVLQEDKDIKLSAKNDASNYQDHHNIKYDFDATELDGIDELIIYDSHK